MAIQPVNSESPKVNRKRLLTFAAVVGFGLVVLSFWYAWVSTVTTVLLLCVTFVYVLLTYDTSRLTHEQFNLLKSQTERQDRVLLFLDLTFAAPNLQLRIFNLGLSSFLVQKIVARTSDDLNSPQTYDQYKIVESGKTETVTLPRDLFDGEGFGTDFEFTVHYIGINGAGSTSPKSFNVFSWEDGDQGGVVITEGLDASWYTYCPKCKGVVLTDVHGLKTLDVAAAPTKQVEEDIAISCPDHKSEWLLTTEKIQEAGKARKNRRKL